MRHRRARRTERYRGRRRRVRAKGLHGQGRGRERERQTGIALQLLRDRGSIASYAMSAPNSALDKDGIDATFTDLEGRQVGFQIKGSERAVRKHLARHPNVPWINVSQCICPEDIAALIREVFNLP